MGRVSRPPSSVPAELDCASWRSLEPYYGALRDRPIDTATALHDWLRDFSDLTEVVDECGAWKHINHTCHTDDPEIEQAYMSFVRDIEPKIKPIYFALQRKFLDAAKATDALHDAVTAHLATRWQADVDAYHKDNIPLQVQETELATAYGKRCGAMMVDYRDRPHTLQQMARYLEDTDRSVREEAWRLVVDRRMQDREEIDRIFDDLVQLRHQMAQNAGHPDYRSYTWLTKHRFDYTPEMSLEFGEACEQFVVPLISELEAQAAADLHLPDLRPWDTEVDPKRRPPLRPFEQDDIAGFVDKTRRIFHRLSPYFGARFATLELGKTLDLESRQGKLPGGYQCSLEKSRTPFIFMNAAGVQNDVLTLLHEGGHAFHHLEACDDVDLVFMRHAPIEFCEVASMSMELLASDAYDEIYTTVDAARARRKTIERAVRVLPWVATIDGFQHWIYTHPTHTHAERAEYWLSLLHRFTSTAVNWSGLEDVRTRLWQRQPHLFSHPFYYIEYGIAELGALQLWQQYRREPDRALAKYRAALALGGTRPLPELFAAAGVSFDFSAKTIAPLIEAVRKELAAIPA